MDLDLHIQNTLKRSEMDTAMHAVVSDFGASYQLTSYNESANLAEQILGDPIGIAANPASTSNLQSAGRPVIGSRAVPFQDELTPLSEMADGFLITYDPAMQKWSLFEAVPEEKTGLLQSWWDKITGKPTQMLIITKYGPKSGHRFLNEIENLNSGRKLTNEQTAAISAVVVEHLGGGMSVWNLQQGLSVDADTQDDIIQMESAEPTIAGSTPVDASGFNNGPMELNLAAEYAGVQKQRNHTFMGDTIVPTPLTRQQMGVGTNMFGNETGIHVAPPVQAFTASTPKTSRSL